MPRKPRILFVDDEVRLLRTLLRICKQDYDVHTADNGATALEIIENQDIDVLVSDQRMPEMAGIEVLRRAKEISPRTMRILLTGYADLTSIIGSINEGEVFRFINKPWANENLKSTLSEAASIAISQLTPLEPEQQQINVAANEKPVVVVLDEDPKTKDIAITSLGDKCDIFHARSLEQTLDLLNQHNVVVLVADLFINQQDVSYLFKILKSEYRSIITIVVSRIKDAKLAISLINEGQIYRYLPKPVKDWQLSSNLQNALRHHANLIRKPVLQARYRVQVPTDTIKSAMSQVVLKWIRSRKARAA